MPTAIRSFRTSTRYWLWECTNDFQRRGANLIVARRGAVDFTVEKLCQKVDPIWNAPANPGNAGAPARYEREARNSHSIKKFEIERAAHAVRARRAPSISLSLPATPLFGQGPVEKHDEVAIAET
jgi:hypothetical protein